ncbi:TetR/AcrR family transcriptional regulator [Streptacidiphilus monticola]
MAASGWSATTVAVVAEHAGVSRGAAQHHFPTREDLITAALDHMFDTRMSWARRRRNRFPTTPTGPSGWCCAWSTGSAARCSRPPCTCGRRLRRTRR